MNVRMINNAFHTYSSAYRDDGYSDIPRRVFIFDGISKIVCQQNGVDSLYDKDDIYDCFQ
jgi:hypothetical protein